MISHWRAFGGSLLLHLLILGSLVVLGGNLSVQPKLERYSFELLAPTPAPTPIPVHAPAPVRQRAVAPPRTLQPAPVKPRPRQPKPAPKPITAHKAPVPQPVVIPPPKPTTPEAVAEQVQPRLATPVPEPMENPQPASVTPAPTIAEPILPPQPSPEELRARQVQSYADAQLQLIRDQVSRKVRYPALARRQGWSGQVVIEFTVLLSGEVRELRVAESCGYPLLDRQALRAVAAAAPFPPPPVVATLTLPVNFELN